MRMIPTNAPLLIFGDPNDSTAPATAIDPLGQTYIDARSCQSLWQGTGKEILAIRSESADGMQRFWFVSLAWLIEQHPDDEEWLKKVDAEIRERAKNEGCPNVF